MHSAIYSGWLRHRRFEPRPHAFRYRLFLLYLDLSELETVFAGRWLWSTRRRALARFDRADHLGDSHVPLDTAVRDLVEQRTGNRPCGPIRLLTHLRYFGYGFNPVSFYYCFDRDDTRIEAIVAEVTNTPWREVHCYVLVSPEGPCSDRFLRYRSQKAHHVSPFMPMDIEYRWVLTPPGERLNVHMALHREEKVFDATMCLARTPLGARSLAGALVAFPLMTIKVIAAIHWEALRLWLKGVPVHTHPRELASAPARSESIIQQGAPAAKRS